MTTDEQPDDYSELAEHLVATVEGLADEIEAGVDDGMAGMMDPEMALGVLKPMLAAWATKNPDEALETLARVYLESEALLERHADEEPEALV